VVFPQSWSETYAYSVLSHILGGTPYSRLFLRLRETKGYSYYAFSEMDILKNCGLFTIRARVRPEVLEESLQEIFTVIREIIVEKKIANYELEQAKSFLIGRLPVELESLDNLAFRLTSMNIYNYGNEYWQKYYSNIMSITPEDVFHVGQKSSLLTPIITLAGDKNIIIENLKFLDIDLYDKNGQFLYTLRKGEKK
jgi:predicted Zn-dependent peptidase